MDKQLVGIEKSLAEQIRRYLGTCPHDHVKEMLAEFDKTAQIIDVKIEEKAESAKV